VEPADRFILLFDTPCPYKDRCPLGKLCCLTGARVLECEQYQRYAQEERERLRRLIRRYVKRGDRN